MFVTAPAAWSLLGPIERKRQMTRIHQFVNRLVRGDDAQDLLEYALLVALIALIAVSAVTAAGVQVDAIFQ